jgi:hypothetical protein
MEEEELPDWDEDGNGNWHERKEEIMAHYWHWHWHWNTGGTTMRMRGNQEQGNREHTAQWEHDVCHDEAVYIFPYLPLLTPHFPDSGDNERSSEMK